MNNKIKIGIIIFSRMSSKRLPGKALKRINGTELLLRSYESCQTIAKEIPIIISTSVSKSDDEIEDLANKKNLILFRGSLNNVLERAYETCQKFDLTHFVRFCGDRPLYPRSLINLLTSSFQDERVDLLSSNLSKNMLPPGLTSEIMSKKSIEYILKKTNDPYHLEHISSYIYQNKKFFNIKELKNIPNINWLDMKFVVDTPKDLKKINCIFKNLDSSFYSNNLVHSLETLYFCHDNCSKIIKKI